MQRASLILFVCLAVAQVRAHHGPVGAPAFYDTDELVILEGNSPKFSGAIRTCASGSG